MADLFESLTGPEHGATDPVELARAHARRNLTKRFYKSAEAARTETGWQIELDGKPVRTPSRQILAVPDERVAEALAVEWNSQGATIDPGTMPLTRMVNSAIDGVADAVAAVADEAAGYASSDLLFYRADGPERLTARQTAHWDPVVAWAEQRLGVRFQLAAGVMPVDQDPAALAAVRAAVPQEPLALAGFHTATTLMGSALLALALWEGRLSPDEAWTAAHVDEDWNIELWGVDAEAVARRVYRKTEMDAAALLMGH
jgi:chaperone required for assembly of F1-ATPase